MGCPVLFIIIMTSLRVRFLFSSLKRFYTTKNLTADNEEISSPSMLSKVTKHNQDTMISDVVTPLWKYDYDEQILMKKKWTEGILRDLENKHLPIKTTLHDVIPSVQVTEYRNLETFNILSGVDGNDKIVGFFVGSRANKDLACVFPQNLKSMRTIHIEVAKVFQDYIRTSPLKACHKLNDGGFWRGITVTSNRDGKVLAIIIAHPSGAPSSDLDSIKESISNYFKEHLPSVESLYLQLSSHSTSTHLQAPYIPISERGYISENIDKYVFRITPESFLPINIETAPLLYDSILNFAKVDKNHTIIDINCGSGAFSIYASSFVRGCVGIDNSSLAIESAMFNVKNNGIRNCHFVHGSLEKGLKEVMNNLKSTLKVVVVIQGGKSAIRKDLIKFLRSFAHLRKLVYISTSEADKDKSLRSYIDLCHPKLDFTYPFRLTNIQPVDMYPHTRYFELVTLFKR